MRKLLVDLEENESGIIVEIIGDQKQVSLLYSLGFRPRKKVIMKKKNFMGYILVILFDEGNAQEHFLTRKDASHILVESGSVPRIYFPERPRIFLPFPRWYYYPFV